MLGRLLLNDEELTKEVSDTTRVIIAATCLIIGFGSFAISFISGNDISLILSVVVGIPIILVGLSLSFGQGSKGKGIMSPFTLYLFGACSALASTSAIYSGEKKLVLAY